MFVQCASALLVAAVLIPGVIPGAADRPAVAVPPAPMQADADHPLWTVLREMDLPPADWARLLAGDADGNRRSDFLDVAMPAAGAAGLSATRAELLVRGTPDVLARIASTVPTAVPVRGQDALFLTATLADVDGLAAAGASMVIWEPRIHASATSTNPAGASPATMDQIELHDGDGAWAASPTRTGSGVTIAILDTGADTGHQALDGGKVSAWKDCTGAGAPAAHDDHGHGTHVASIAAGDDGTDFRGMAYQASINAVKVLDAAGSGSLAWFDCGVAWVESGGAGGAKTADVASMSAGLAVPPLAVTTLNGGPIDYFGWDVAAKPLYLADIPFAVAAGNWIAAAEFVGLDETTHVGVNGVNQVSSPGYGTYVLTVGAVDEVRAPAAFTAIGPGYPSVYKPDVAAMGLDVWGALDGQPSWYGQWSGTSMAAPLVGGALATLYQDNPSLTAQAYHNAIKNGAVQGCILSSTATTCTVKEMPDPNFVMGHGVLHVTNSLALV